MLLKRLLYGVLAERARRDVVEEEFYESNRANPTRVPVGRIRKEHGRETRPRRGRKSRQTVARLAKERQLANNL